MTRRLLLSYLSLTAFVLLVLEVPLGATFARSERRSLAADVTRDALLVATLVEDELELPEPGDVSAPARSYAARTGGRVVITDARGIALADTDPPSAGARDFSTRPEVAQALRGETATGYRHSSTLGYDLLYVAVPVASGGQVFGAVRITYPARTVEERIRRNWLVLALVAVVVLAAVAVVGWQLARSVSGPILTLEGAAARMAAGDLSVRAREGSGPPEVRALARTLDGMAVRLQELLGAQRAFVADASHQLRTPLTALRLRLENLEPAIAADAAEDLEAALAETVRLARIVEGLLTLARAEGAPAALETVDVDAVLEERHAAWGALAAERGLRLDLDARSDRTAQIVPGGLEQIADNLLANAIDAAPSGTAVTLRSLAADGRVEVHVLDRGPGMTEDQRVRAFDRFWRSGSAGPGSGLGLSIVRELAVAAGGSAELRGRDGGGLDAVVILRDAGT